MAVDPAAIEKLRENSHIRLDAEGRFWHEGVLVEHPRIALAFHRGLGRAPDGRPTITIGRTWCYIAADGALYRVLGLACETTGDGTVTRCHLRLDDETEEDLVPAGGTIGLDANGVLHLRVKNSREWARLLPAAQAELGRHAQMDAAGRIGFETPEGFAAPVEI